MVYGGRVSFSKQKRLVVFDKSFQGLKGLEFGESGRLDVQMEVVGKRLVENNGAQFNEVDFKILSAKQIDDGGKRSA